jgi:hypothetical protein
LGTPHISAHSDPDCLCHVSVKFVVVICKSEFVLIDDTQSRENLMGIVSTNTGHRWPGRTIPFVIDDGDFPAGSPGRAVVTAAIVAWNSQNIAALLPRSNQGDFVRFREVAANLHSRIGRQGGEQGIYCDLGSSRQKKIPDQKSKASPGAGLHRWAAAHGSPRRFIERSMAFDL